MTTRVTLMTAALALLCAAAGCQKQPAGPGVQVQVRAEPKQGYTPPGPEDTGYLLPGDPALKQSSHDHAYHLIDYRKLRGIVVWVEPLGGEVPTKYATPLNATVSLDDVPPVPAEDFRVVSVGGRVSLTSARRADSSHAKAGTEPAAFIVRTQAGEIIPVPQQNPVFTPSKPGLVEVLAEGADEPVASIFVAPTPIAEKAVGGERVTFAPLTPGKYRVTTWHPILPGSSEVVEVAPGKLSKLTLTVGVNSLPKPGR